MSNDYDRWLTDYDGWVQEQAKLSEEYWEAEAAKADAEYDRVRDEQLIADLVRDIVKEDE